MERCPIHRGKVSAIRLRDLDSIIQAFGYSAAENLLRSIADHLGKQPLRVVGRLGRAVFAIVANRGTLNERFLDELKAYASTEFIDSPHFICGLVQAPQQGQGAEELVRRAETALAHCFDRRRSWSLYVDTMEPDPLDLRLVAEFHKSGGRNIKAVFQPQIDLHTGHVSGAEVLARWHHPELGAISPGRFVPLLEKAGLIGLLTERMVEHGIRLSASLRSQNLPSCVSVNISAEDLLYSPLVELVQECLASNGVQAQDLILELTETSLATDPEAANEVLQTLNEIGVGIAIDDFGSGYSSLQYLSTFPVHELKIDRFFVCDMLVQSCNASIVKSTTEPVNIVVV